MKQLPTRRKTGSRRTEIVLETQEEKERRKKEDSENVKEIVKCRWFFGC
jgi:hypothetical protein